MATNAISFTPPPGYVLIGSTATGKTVECIQVALIPEATWRSAERPTPPTAA